MILTHSQYYQNSCRKFAILPETLSMVKAISEKKLIPFFKTDRKFALNIHLD